MDNVNIMTPGEKIKNIRTTYKLKQYEITGGKITRNLVSYIENDKVKLTRQTAEIICENINKACLQKGINFQTTIDYLMENVENQASTIASNYLKYLNSLNFHIPEDFHKTLREIDSFLFKYDISEAKVDIFTQIADILKENREYNKAYIYYIKAFENCNKFCDEIKQTQLINAIAVCCSRLNNFRQIIDFNSIALSYESVLPKNLVFTVKLNNVIAYKKLGDYDNALKELEYLDRDYDLTYDRYFKIITLKANCFKEKKYYNKAITLHQTLLDIVDKNDTERLLIVLCNIIDVYTTLNDTMNLKIYLEKCFDVMNSYDSQTEKPYSPDIYSQIALALKKISSLKLSREYFKKALKASSEYIKSDILFSTFNNLIDICIDEQNNEELNNLKNELLEFISLDILPPNNILILKFINYYNDIDDRDTIRSILNFLLK